MSTDDLDRSVLPIPSRPHEGELPLDAKDPGDLPADRAAAAAGGRAERARSSCSTTSASPPRARSAGPCATPTAERLAAGGLKYNRFHTTALCAPTRPALLTGRNHHTVGMGGITELATSAPGYSSVRPNTCAPLARDAAAERLLDRAVRQVPRGAGVADEPDGPVRRLADRRRRVRALLRLHRRRDEPVLPGDLRRARRRSSRRRRRRRATTSPRT